MQRFIAVFALMISPLVLAAPAMPLRTGEYVFHHKFAEQPAVESIALLARINGHHIMLINESESAVFPKGVIAEGTLMWHSQSRQWIIGEKKSDRHLKEVGGCSAGPDVVDLQQRIYWTC
jgi:hypothetical protein